MNGPETPTVGLVVGYLFDVDQANAEAQRLQLSARFSLILNAYASDEVGKSFDLELLASLLVRVLGWVGVDSLSVTTDDAQTLSFPSVEALRQYYQGLPAETEPFALLRALEHDRVKCLVETEPYALAGGPMPYHDQWVFAFYVANYERTELQKLILRLCVELDVPMSEIRQGSVHPQFTLATRLRRMLP
jgi:hypothetical protein